MDPHQQKIIEAAHNLGIEVEELEGKWQLDAIRLRYEGRSEMVVLGRVFSHLNVVADQIAAHKVAAKEFMQGLGIPVPASLKIEPGSILYEEIEAFMDKYNPVVAKPLFGTDGIGIAMHLTTMGQVVDHLQANLNMEGPWLLEEQVEGDDLRIQYLNGKLIAACIRKPCFVVGDGRSSVKELIEQRNEVILEQNADNHISVDQQVRRRLAEAELSLTSVLGKGLELQLKDISNMAQGGLAIDVTDEVHPLYQEYLDKIADALGIRLFSLDVMTPTPLADPAKHARVLEMNAQPAWLHHTFSEDRQHDVPTLILKDLFGID